ncbi:MAG: hypothetical protein JNM68_15980, partial [Dinghuibacter sp.]|nr:hypothetical protein [Dinghuibacter sp.]
MNKQAETLLRHPKIKALKQKLEHTISLAVEKAVGHMQNPAAYPMPANPKTLERAIFNLVSDLPARKRKKILEKVNPFLNGSTVQRRSHYGELAAVNLKLPNAILEQVSAVPVPDTLKMATEEAEALLQQIYPAPKIKRAAAAQQPRAINTGTVDFFVDQLTCNKKSELGKDEIVLEGIVANGLNEPVNLAPIDLKKFKKGESKTVSTSPLFTFDIFEDSTGSVQNLTAMLFLREKDRIRDSGLAFKISIVLALIALALAFLALGIAIAGTILALTSQALFVAMLASFFTATGISPFAFYIIPMLADDISTVGTDTLAIDSTIQTGDVFERTVNFELVNSDDDLTKGKYTA